MITVLALAAAATPPELGRITELLSEPLDFAFQSARPPEALEFCVADQASTIGGVSVVHDGPGRIVVVPMTIEGRPVAAVELRGSGEGTSLAGHVAHRGFDDRLRERISRCF